MARKAKDNETKIYKSIPTTENGVGTTCLTRSGKEYLITQNVERCRFTLWESVDGGYIRLKSEDSPYAFNEFLGYKITR